MASPMTAMTAEQLRAELIEKIALARARSAAMEALGDAEIAAILADHAEYLGAVAARLSGMAAAPQWQPIETAPKDGTDYITTDGKRCMIENQQPGHMPGTWIKDEGTARGWSGWASRPIGYSPTHWMRVPEPPHA